MLIAWLVSALLGILVGSVLGVLSPTLLLAILTLVAICLRNLYDEDITKLPYVYIGAFGWATVIAMWVIHFNR